MSSDATTDDGKSEDEKTEDDAPASRHPWPRRLLVGAGALAAVALVASGIVVASNRSPAGGSDEHDMSAMGHDMDHDHDMAGAGTPRPYDATLPVDLSGVPGVTAEEQATAEDLLTRTIEELPRFADPATALAEGYVPFGDDVTGFVHYNNWSRVEDGTMLDPEHPESVVYRIEDDGSLTLVATMFMLQPRDTFEDVPALGGELIQWHVHNDLCYVGTKHNWTAIAGAPLSEPCPAGTFRFRTEQPMMHVWIVPNECGPFAALEGIGAGQTPGAAERACDHAHGAEPGTGSAAASAETS